jgi:hypothetical protein
MENQTLEVKQMNWVSTPESKAMSAYAYHPASYTFGVKTLDGTPYFYLEVTPDVHAQFLAAPSKGSFWLKNIKPKYQCRKGDGELAKQSPTATPIHPKVEQIIVSEGEKAATPLALSTAAVDVSIVRPFGSQVAELKTKMDEHCILILADVTQLTAQAARQTVTDGESYTAAAELGTKLADARKGIAVMMKPTKQAIDSVKDVVLAKEKQLLGVIHIGEERMNQLCTAYRTEQTRITKEAAEAERRRLLREAEDKRIAEAEKAHDAGRTVLADKLLSTPVTAPAVKVEQAVPKTSASGRTNWKYRITDRSLIPDEFWMLDESMIAQQVRRDKEKTVIPGIEAYPDESTNF